MKKNEISFLNVLFCLIVIFIHICSEPVTQLSRGGICHIIVYTMWRLSGFVVQGFIFLSGLKLFLSKKETGYTEYIGSRFIKICLPYIFAVCIYYLYFYLEGYFSFSTTELGMYIIKGDLSAQFYFVIVIMQFYLLKPLWSSLLSRIPHGAFLALSLAVTLFGVTLLPSVFGTFNDRVFTTYLIYWAMGCIAGKSYKDFTAYISRNKRIIILAFFLTAICEVYISYIGILPYYASELLHMAYCILAVLTCMLTAGAIGDYFMKGKLFRSINASSYYIYLWHVLAIFLINQEMDNMGIASTGTRLFIRGAIVYALSILLCGAYVKLKKRLRG